MQLDLTLIIFLPTRKQAPETKGVNHFLQLESLDGCLEPIKSWENSVSPGMLVWVTAIFAARDTHAFPLLCTHSAKWWGPYHLSALTVNGNR